MSETLGFPEDTNIQKGRQAVVDEETRLTAAGRAADIRTEIQRGTKDTINKKIKDAQDAKREYETTGKVKKDEANNSLRTLGVFMQAADHGHIDPPTDPASRAVYESLVAKLPGNIDNKNAPYILPFIKDLLDTRNFVQLSPGGGLNTDFEKQLVTMVSQLDDNTQRLIREILVDASTRPGFPTGLTVPDLDAKVQAAKDEKKKLVGAVNRRSQEQEDSYIAEILQKAEGATAEQAREFFNNLSTPDAFHKYYENEIEKKMPPHGTIATREVAAQAVTQDFQKTLMFIVYNIYSPVLSGSQDKEFNRAVSEVGGAYMQNPTTFYNRLRNKIIHLADGIDLYSAKYDRVDQDVYYQVGNEDILTYEHKNDGKGKLVRESVPTGNLIKSAFKDFVGNMGVTTDTIRDWLEIGHNANYLHLTGAVGEGKSFYQQKAAYAEQKLPANHIDELYRLPFADFVGAVRRELDSYSRQVLAMNGWRKEPRILMTIFQDINAIERDVLHDLVKHFKDQHDIPEWAIRPAIMHARTHLTMISLQPESLAGYAHSPLEDLGNPSFKDPSFKGLEVYRTWYGAEQWRSSDALVKGLAWLPQPKRTLRFDDWRPDDVEAEGQQIYKESFEKGKLSLVERNYFDSSTPPNILEINPMKFGGVEQQMGWRIKYPYIDWLSDMIDHVESEVELKADNPKDFEYAWKRLENVGVHVLKSMSNEMILNDGFLKLDGTGNVAKQEQYEQFFKFLYKRYFSTGVGKEGMKKTFRTSDLREHTVDYNLINSADDFWDEVVKPILTRNGPKAIDETDKDHSDRNLNERKADLAGIVQQAMTVIAWERSPLDFAYIENPTRSQNGYTLMRHLMNKYVPTNPDSPEHKAENIKQVQDLRNAFNDISFVEMEVQRKTEQDMKSFVDEQIERDRARGVVTPKSLFVRDQANMDQIKSDVRGGKGYAMDENDLREILKERYIDRYPSLSVSERNAAQERIDRALDVYKEMRNCVVNKPQEQEYERTINVSDERLKLEMRMREMNPDDADALHAFRQQRIAEMREGYRKARDSMSTRLEWSGDEIFNGEGAFIINDTIFSALRMSNSGRSVISRTVSAIANTQEMYKRTMADGEMLSALSKAYRGGEYDEVLEKIKDVRSSVKGEDENTGNDIAMYMLENALNLVRIDSRAENPLIAGKMRLEGKNLSAMDEIVKEGERNPLSREERWAVVREALHSSFFARDAKGGAKKYEVEDNWEAVMGNIPLIGSVASKLGAVADQYLGTAAGRLVRKKFKEATGEGLRDREIATIMNILMKEGPSKILLALLALMIFLSVKGAQEAAEAT